jgi:hypothetical protein
VEIQLTKLCNIGLKNKMACAAACGWGGKHSWRGAGARAFPSAARIPPAQREMLQRGAHCGAEGSRRSGAEGGAGSGDAHPAQRRSGPGVARLRGRGPGVPPGGTEATLAGPVRPVRPVRWGPAHVRGSAPTMTWRLAVVGGPRRGGWSWWAASRPP